MLAFDPPAARGRLIRGQASRRLNADRHLMITNGTYMVLGGPKARIDVSSRAGSMNFIDPGSMSQELENRVYALMGTWYTWSWMVHKIQYNADN